MERGFCPLRSDVKDESICWDKDCALYDEGYRCCCLKSIAIRLEQIIDQSTQTVIKVKEI